ncbi:hypothetical protein MVEN_01330200 [Mycena venus]|uniref:Uncharacterized protein n=1 Tax=Mycena venus TaxID=2733690 RepID=A0A8H6Y0P9_9AGAR|nr:hypothetical protein MVEN_01330200 [Mycena venus]
MSHSAEKDRFIAIAIYRAPPQMSNQEFEATMKSFADTIVALPIVQNNLLKCDMMSSNNLFQSETSDQMIEIFNDTEMQQKLVEVAEKLTFQGGASSPLFSVDVLEKFKKNKLGVDRKNPLHTQSWAMPQFSKILSDIRYGSQMWLPSMASFWGNLQSTLPFLILLESENWDAMVEIAKDEGVQNIIAHGNEDFGFHAESSSFCVDIVTKFKKE